MIPLAYIGGGKFEASSPYHAARCREHYGKGEVVHFEEVQERSLNSHRHYFCCIAEAWRTLPETMADDFLSPEHLRKWALIKAGYCDVAKLVLPDNKAAIDACALMTSMDRYSVCNVEGRVVTVARAKSQSMKAMGKAEFQASKDDVLRVLSRLLGADASHLGKAA